MTVDDRAAAPGVDTPEWGGRVAGLLQLGLDGARPGGPRLFSSTAEEPRARRVTDAIVLGGCVLALVLSSAFAVPSPAFAQAVSRLFSSLPSFFDAGWQFLLDAFSLFAIALIVAALVRRRWPIVRDLLLAVATAIVVWQVVARAVTGEWPATLDSLRAAAAPPWYPSPRVALPAAIFLTASPHFTRPVRRAGWWSMLLATLSVTALQAAQPLGALAGLLVGAIAAACVHLAVGSSAGRPGLGLVASALAQLGVPTTALGAADRQQAGLFLVNATDTHGRRLIVKVYGRDAHDAAIVSTLWRTVWYREAGSPLRFRRLEQVEHEAFLTLLAKQAGIVTDTVVTAGTTAEDDALLVLSRQSVPLPTDTSEELAPALWRLVDDLRRAGIAHGQLDDEHLVVDAERLGVVDFRGATVAPSDVQQRTDDVQALMTMVLRVGVPPALDSATAAIGVDRLAAMLPLLQISSLTPGQRRAVRDRDVDLDDVRQAAADSVGVEAPPLQQLRRITVGSIVRVVLPAVAVLFLISGLAGLDFEVLWRELGDAAWWLVAVGFLMTQVPRLSQAVSTLGASPVPLPLGPVYALQLAISYVNLAIPSTAGRIAVNLRFFQRHGVPPGAALAAGALDGFGGFVAQILLLLTLLAFSSVSLDLDLGSAAGSAGRILVLVVIIAVVAVAVVVVVPPLRRFVLGWARRLGGQAWEAVRGLRSPRRLLMLFGGNFLTEVLFAIALGTFTRALGYPIGLGELLLVNISTALLAGLMPIPGGIGVAEGALTYGLVRAGMPEETAFAAVLMYRLSSFYLPPIWGYFALNWLERKRHL